MEIHNILGCRSACAGWTNDRDDVREIGSSILMMITVDVYVFTFFLGLINFTSKNILIYNILLF